MKWAGGKGWLAEIAVTELLREGIALDSFDSYYEPFCGSAAFFFHLRRAGFDKQAFLSDANERLVAFYKGLTANPLEMSTQYAQAAASYNSSTFQEERYYTWREQANAGDPIAFLLVNRAGYNGLWRENKQGNCNVPWGKRKTLPNLTVALVGAAKALRNATVFCQPWEEVLTPRFRGAQRLVYIDAPYVGTFVGYGARRWAAEDDHALAKRIDTIVSHGATVLWSLPDSEHAHEVLATLENKPGVLRVTKPGQISAGKRKPQHEVIALIRARS